MTQTPVPPGTPKEPKADPEVVDALKDISDAQQRAADVVKQKQLEAFTTAAGGVVQQETVTTQILRLEEPVQWTDLSGAVQSATAVQLTQLTAEDGTVTRSVVPGYAAVGPDGQYYITGFSNSLPEELFDLLTPSTVKSDPK